MAFLENRLQDDGSIKFLKYKKMGPFEEAPLRDERPKSACWTPALSWRLVSAFANIAHEYAFRPKRRVEDSHLSWS